MRNLILSVIVCAFMGLFAGCEPSHEEAMSVLESEGLHDIRLLGWKTFACSDDDDFNVEFAAKRTMLDREGHPTEIDVSGVLCCGLMKSCTVRH